MGVVWASAQTSQVQAPPPAGVLQSQMEVEYQRGTKLLQKGRYSGALDQFRAMERRNPQSPYGPTEELLCH